MGVDVAVGGTAVAVGTVVAVGCCVGVGGTDVGVGGTNVGVGAGGAGTRVAVGGSGVRTVVAVGTGCESAMDVGAMVDTAVVGESTVVVLQPTTTMSMVVARIMAVRSALEMSKDFIITEVEAT